MANYYQNKHPNKNKIITTDSGASLLLKVGEFVKGSYFARLATLGLLTDEGSSEPAEVTANPDLLIYTQVETIGGTVESGEITDNAVTTAKLAANAITSAKVANNAVTETKIADGAVTETKIADGAVTGDKIDVGFADLNDYPANAEGSLTNDGLGNLTFTNNAVNVTHVAEWREHTNGVWGGSGQPLYIIADAADYSQLLSISTTGAVAISSDSGRTWANATTPPSASVQTIPVMEGGVGLAGTTIAGAWYTTDYGDTWTQATGIATDASVQSVATSPYTIGLAFAGVGTSIYKSTDSGVTWAASNTGITANKQATCFAFDNSSGITYAGLYPSVLGIAKSTDDGATWTVTSSGINFFKPLSIVVDPITNYVYMAVQDNPPDTGGGKIYKSTDLGETWTQITTGFSTSLNTPTAFVGHRDGTKMVLYLGVNTPSNPNNAPFLYRSIDEGASWHRYDGDPMPGYNPNNSINSLSISSPYLIATPKGLKPYFSLITTQKVLFEKSKGTLEELPFGYWNTEEEAFNLNANLTTNRLTLQPNPPELVSKIIINSGTPDSTIQVEASNALMQLRFTPSDTPELEFIAQDTSENPVPITVILQPGTPPASASATGTKGSIIIGTDGYLYFCSATDTWIRVQMVTW